jgi:hypothetical protein
MSDNLIILDANSVSRVLKTTENAYSEHTPHHNVDAFPLQHIDSFSRLRTSNPGYRFDSQLTYQIDSDLWDTDDNSGNGSVTHDYIERWAELQADDSVASNYAILQSHYHAPYTPGRGQLAFITFLFGAPLAEGERKAGYWDGNDGVYLRENSGGLALVLASSTTYGDQVVAQANWNIDPLDGTGPSGLTINTAYVQILVVQLQALYVGRVVVGFDIDGQVVPVHAFNHANYITYTYMAQASLPVRYEVTADNTAAPVTMAAICASVVSEGGDALQEIEGRPFAVKVGMAELSGTAAEVVAVLRAKEQLNSIDQNALALPVDMNVSCVNAGAWFEVYYNPTISAGTFADVDANSALEWSYLGNGGTDPAVSANGRLVDAVYVPAAANVRNSDSRNLAGKLVLAYSHLLAAGDSLAIIATGAAATDLWLGLKWKEIR